MQRILFEIPILGIPIYAYGFMIMVSFLYGLFMSGNRLEAMGLRKEHMYDVTLMAMLSGIIGGRLFHTIQYSDEVGGFWGFFRVWEGGLVFYGGFIGASLCTIGFIVWRRLPLLKMCDVLAPCVALGLAFTRQGCFLNGCCWGAPCDAGYSLAVRYPPDSLPYRHYMSELGDNPHLHPAQLYSAGVALAIFGVLNFVYPRRRANGQILFLFLVLYGTGRFVLESLRDDEVPVFGTGLTISQNISLVMIAIGVAGLTIVRRRARRPRSDGPPAPAASDAGEPAEAKR